MHPLHRDGGRACGRCVFCVEFIRKGEIKGSLQCRKGPPSVVAIPAGRDANGNPRLSLMSVPPPVPENHWCYEFRELLLGESRDVMSENTFIPPPAANG